MPQDTVKFNLTAPDTTTDTVTFDFGTSTDSVTFDLRPPRIEPEQEQKRAPTSITQACISGVGSGGLFIEPEVKIGYKRNTINNNK